MGSPAAGLGVAAGVGGSGVEVGVGSGVFVTVGLTGMVASGVGVEGVCPVAMAVASCVREGSGVAEAEEGFVGVSVPVAVASSVEEGSGAVGVTTGCVSIAVGCGVSVAVWAKAGDIPGKSIDKMTIAWMRRVIKAREVGIERQK